MRGALGGRYGGTHKDGAKARICVWVRASRSGMFVSVYVCVRKVSWVIVCGCMGKWVSEYECTDITSYYIQVGWYIFMYVYVCMYVCVYVCVYVVYV